MTGDRVPAQEARRGCAVIIGTSLLAAVGGFWFGEASVSPGLAELLAALAFAAAGFALHRGPWLRRALAAAATVGVFAIALVAGGESSRRAYNECVARGEEVRSALAEFRSRTGRYPQSLDEIPHQLACRRMLRGSILKYEMTKSGYHLRFGDWLVSHSATESEGFTPHK